MPLASFAAAAVARNHDLEAAVRRLDTGDWNDRIRTVHQLEYMQDSGLPALAIAAEDGDWQVRMAAVQALGSLGAPATPILLSIMKNEACPVVRLIALHNLGSLGDEGAEEESIRWMFSASAAQINACRDHPAPGRAAWSAHRLPAKPAPPVPKALPPVPQAPPLVAKATPPAPAPPAPPPPRPVVRQLGAPTKNERYAELDALLAEPLGSKEAPGAARTTPPKRRASTPETLPDSPLVELPPDHAITAPGTFAAARGKAPAAATPPWPPGMPESLPDSVLAAPVPDHAVAAPGIFEASGSKAPHDAIPDLLLALKKGDPGTRARAADDLGSFGAEAAPAVPALISALKDKNRRVRASASLALGNIGAEREDVVALLAKAMKDKNPDVRYAATLALSRISSPAARAAFKERVGEDALRAIKQQP